jgi:uncharacterized protein YigE (DUF2233 family)
MIKEYREYGDMIAHMLHSTKILLPRGPLKGSYDRMREIPGCISDKNLSRSVYPMKVNLHHFTILYRSRCKFDTIVFLGSQCAHISDINEPWSLFKFGPQINLAPSFRHASSDLDRTRQRGNLRRPH